MESYPQSGQVQRSAGASLSLELADSISCQSCAYSLETQSPHKYSNSPLNPVNTRTVTILSCWHLLQPGNSSTGAAGMALGPLPAAACNALSATSFSGDKGAALSRAACSRSSA